MNIRHVHLVTFIVSAKTTLTQQVSGNGDQPKMSTYSHRVAYAQGSICITHIVEKIAVALINQETPNLTWRIRIRGKTMGSSQPNLLPLYACGITTSSSLDSTTGSYTSRFHYLGQQQDLGAASSSIERSHQRVMEQQIRGTTMWI